MRILFEVLLALTPRDFRREFGDELRRVADERCREAREQRGRMAAASARAREVLALGRVALELRRAATPAGAVTLESVARDLGLGARSLARRPGFALITAGTLGLGIGSVTTMFSAVNTVLLRPLPYADSDRIVTLFRTDLETGERGNGMSAADVVDIGAIATRMESVAVAEPWSLDYRVDDRTESLRAWAVSSAFFEALGVEPILGRTFVPLEYADGGDAVAILGHGAWVSRFGADPGIVGGTLTLDASPTTIVGVLPPEFGFPNRAELWLPRPPRSWDQESRSQDFMAGVARLGPGASLAEARAELDRIGTSLAEDYPESNWGSGFTAVPLRDHLFGDVRTPLLVMLVAVALVLLIACANVAALVLSRGAQREREYALRGAMGAGIGRMIAHVAAESVVLAGAGCVLGIGMTYGGVAALRRLGPSHLPRIDELQVDGTVLLFGIALGALSALLAGLTPCLRLARPDLAGALSDGARGTGGLRHRRLRGRLVVVQVASSMVLLIGAGLLLRSFRTLVGQELGFDPQDRLAVQLFAYDYANPGERSAFLSRAIENVEAVPGVRGVALTSEVPGATDGVIARLDIDLPFTIADRAVPPAGQEPVARANAVSPDYFELMGIQVLSGRGPARSDLPETPPVIAVNETLSRQISGDGNPIGERLRIRFGRRDVDWEVVGVVRDIRALGHASEPRAEVFFPMSQVDVGSLVLVARTEVDAATLTRAVMEAIWRANPAQSIWGVSTVDGLVADWLRGRRFNLLLLSAFATVSLVLAAVGIYGLVSFSVERRVAELGIRRALGGGSAALMGMVIREGATLAGIGVALGVVIALGLSRFIRGMLYGVEPTDPLTVGALAASMLAVAMAASLVPALRAMRVDPVRVLRGE